MKDILQKLKTEMILRGFSESTTKTYIFFNKKFLEFCKKEPEQVTQEDIKTFVAGLVQKNTNTASVAIAALRFFYDVVLCKNLFADFAMPKKEKNLPVVLTKEEVCRLLQAAQTRKSWLIISMLYACGLRVGELVGLKKKDIMLQQKIGVVRKGKGKKDRLFVLPEKLVQPLAEFMNSHDSEYIFPGRNGRKLTTRNVQKIVSNTAKIAEIGKRVTPHTLRHSYATHLLEQGVDIRKIQELLGHAQLSTTQVYTHVNVAELKKIKLPFDYLELENI